MNLEAGADRVREHICITDHQSREARSGYRASGNELGDGEWGGALAGVNMPEVTWAKESQGQGLGVGSGGTPLWAGTSAYRAQWDRHCKKQHSHSGSGY